jgi:hypothetical protein
VDALFVGAGPADAVALGVGGGSVVVVGAAVVVDEGAGPAEFAALATESGCFAVGSGPQPKTIQDVMPRQTRTEPEGRMAQVDANSLAASTGKRSSCTVMRRAHGQTDLV